MARYVMPLQTAALLFPLIALALTVPYMVSQYRRYGAVLFLRTLCVYSFVFYLMCCYCLVILPLPERSNAAAFYAPWRCNLVPFSYLPDLLAESTQLVWSDPRTYLPALLSSGLYDPVFNIVMLIPFGIYLRYYFQQGWRRTAALAFALSLFFEITQLTGLYFLYPAPYRLCDVNDLISNTLGGLAGWGLTPLITHFLPSRRRLDERARERGSRVTYTRRLVAFLFDAPAMAALAALAAFCLPAWPLKPLLAAWLAAFIYHGLGVYWTGGRTLGKALVRIRVADQGGGRVSLPQALLRALLLHGLCHGLSVALTGAGEAAPWEQPVSMLAGLTSLAFWGAGFVCAAQGKPMWYERLTATTQVSTVQRQPSHQQQKEAPLHDL